MKNYDKLRISYILLGIYIIIYIIYIRLLVVRLPRELQLYINGNLNRSLLIVIIISIFIFSNVFVMNILLLYNIELKVNPLLGNILLKLNDIISKALYEVYRLTEVFESDGYNNLAKIVNKFYSIFGNITETFFILLTFSVRLVIVIIFLLDVFYFFQLNYFYKSLGLLWINIIVHIWIFILKDFAKNLEDAKAFLIIEEKGTDEETGLPITKFSRSKNNENIDLRYHVQQYILCSKIDGYLQIYKAYANYFTIRFDILISSLYLIGWFYVIFINLLLVC